MEPVDVILSKAPDNLTSSQGEMYQDIQRIADSVDRQRQGRYDWEEMSRLDRECWELLEKLDKELSPFLQAGRYLTFGVADGKAVYLITEVKSRTVKVRHIPLQDGYSSEFVVNNNISMQVAVNSIGRRDAMSRIFSSR